MMLFLGPDDATGAPVSTDVVDTRDAALCSATVPVLHSDRRAANSRDTVGSLPSTTLGMSAVRVRLSTDWNDA